MRHWPMTQQGLTGLFLVVLILAGCAAAGNDSPAEGCGGVEARVSCLQVTNVTFVSGSSNVDARRTSCFDSTTGITTPDVPLTDDSVQITFMNNPFLTADKSVGFAIRLLGFSVSYSLNQCPASARGCPPLPGFTESAPTVIIPALGGSASLTVPLVPLRVKQAYTAAGGELFSASLPSYAATYVITAETVGFNDTITATAATSFTIGDFVTSGFCPAPGIIQ